MNKKEIIKSSVLGVVGVVIGVSISVIANGAMELEVYENDYIEKSQALQVAQLNLCNSEKSLALAKLEVYASGNIDYAQDVLNRLTVKSKQICEAVVEEKDVLASYDEHCLYEAVAIAESGYCKAGTSGALKNNCVSIMEWPNGTRQLKSYSSIEENEKDFLRIWNTYYKEYPNEKLAKKYTGNDNPTTWLKNVNSSYNKCVDK